MNATKAGSIVLILGGVALTYLAVTGYASGVWDALKGPSGATGVSAPSGDSTKEVQAAGGVSRALGRGAGGAVTNTPQSYKGVYYPSPSGGLMSSDAGVW